MTRWVLVLFTPIIGWLIGKTYFTKDWAVAVFALYHAILTGLIFILINNI